MFWLDRCNGSWAVGRGISGLAEKGYVMEKVVREGTGTPLSGGGRAHVQSRGLGSRPPQCRSCVRQGTREISWLEVSRNCKSIKHLVIEEAQPHTLVQQYAVIALQQDQLNASQFAGNLERSQQGKRHLADRTC
ncbi:hypothetical protein AAFF_G00262790 [Aldrovandia affinis]|uniref:Uncharacterized protein n=1 Tax=Aldrovandia affinis TaxID=143900 RepID=A0AAD7SUH6_9TELE|nr:hypothetical protein AAFF_G00262790 [Aldrovandia affinis]